MSFRSCFRAPARLRVACAARSAALILCLVALSAAPQAGVRTVGGANADHPSIAAAVSAAVDGDLVLVRAGTYGGFTLDGKAVAIVADAGADVIVFGPVRVQNLAPGRMARLTGLAVASVGSDALAVRDCVGSVRIEECVCSAYTLSASTPVHGAVVTHADDVVFARSTLRGGVASTSGAAAGDGARCANARVALLASETRGAPGAHGDSGAPAAGGAGGVGLRVVASEVYASDATFVGGDGGRGGVAPTGLGGCASGQPLVGGDGGVGLVVDGASIVRSRAAHEHGGAGGIGGVNTCGSFASPGADGAARVGTVVALSGAACGLRTPRVARAGTPATLTVTGAPGDRVVLFVTSRPAHQWNGVFDAPQLVGAPIERRVTAGVLPPSGSADVIVVVPALAPGRLFLARQIQAWVLTPGGPARLGDAATWTVVDASL